MIDALKSIAVAAAIGAAGYGVYRVHDAVWQSGWDARDMRAKADTAAALEEAITEERRLQKEKEDAYKKKIAALQKRERDVVAGADVANGLLDASRESLRQAAGSLEACVVSANTHAELLGKCQREYRGVAAAADGHVADIKALGGLADKD